LIHLDLSKPFVLETNTSNFGVGVMLPQLGQNNLLHPIGFHSSNFSPVEINYEIHDIKNLAMVDAFEEWCHLFEGAQHEIIVYLNHKKLQYFMTIHVLNQHQVRWAFFCLNSSLSSDIILGSSKGNMMCCLVIHTSRLSKEMLLTNNNVMSFSNLNIFRF